MNFLLQIDKIKLAIQKRIGKKQKKSSKNYASWLARGYQNEPKVSIIIESHNKSLQVMHVVEKLRKYPSLEIIVIDDGSDKEHTERLSAGLIRGNEFLVRANDLYENVMYNKCIRFAQANIIALLQDDDDFDNLHWLSEALELMHKYPEMVILGGQDGFEVTFNDGDGKIHTFEENMTIPIKDLARATRGKVYSGDGKFRFVPAVNRAPMFINRSLFLKHLKNIPFSYAPFQLDDNEICLRAWLCGLQVGSYSANFKSLSVGGMRIWNNAFTDEQTRRNAPQLYKTYKNHIDEINKKVADANQKFKM